MQLRADHVAGGFFVVFGAAVIALSGDLPTGQLSMPGSGFLPKIVAVLTILFGLVLIVRASHESPPFSDIDWSDGKHAVTVTAITALAIALYTVLGFLITMTVMIVGLLIVIERRNPLRAAAYGIGIVLFTYICFAMLLKTPLPEMSFSF